MSLKIPIDPVALTEALPFLVCTVGFDKPLRLAKAVLAAVSAHNNANKSRQLVGSLFFILSRHFCLQRRQQVTTTCWFIVHFLSFQFKFSQLITTGSPYSLALPPSTLAQSMYLV